MSASPNGQSIATKARGQKTCYRKPRDTGNGGVINAGHIPDSAQHQRYTMHAISAVDSRVDTPECLRPLPAPPYTDSFNYLHNARFDDNCSRQLGGIQSGTIFIHKGGYGIYSGEGVDVPGEGEGQFLLSKSWYPMPCQPLPRYHRHKL